MATSESLADQILHIAKTYKWVVSCMYVWWLNKEILSWQNDLGSGPSLKARRGVQTDCWSKKLRPLMTYEVIWKAPWRDEQSNGNVEQKVWPSKSITDKVCPSITL